MTYLQTLPLMSVATSTGDTPILDDPYFELAADALRQRGRLSSADAAELLRRTRQYEALKRWRGLIH